MRLTSFSFPVPQHRRELHNQCVRALKSNFSEKKALAFLYKLEQHTLELVELSKQISALAEGFQTKIPRQMIAKISQGGSLHGGCLPTTKSKVDGTSCGRAFGNRIIRPPGDNPYTIEHISRSFVDYLTANRKTEKPILHLAQSRSERLRDRGTVHKIGGAVYAAHGLATSLYRLPPQRHRAGTPAYRFRPCGRNRAGDFRQLRTRAFDEGLPGIGTAVRPYPGYQKEWKEGLPLSPVDYEGGNLKGQLAGVIRPIAREWRFGTLGEYRAVLSLYGITVDEVKGEYGGRSITACPIRRRTRTATKVGKPFKSSVFGKEVGIAALEAYALFRRMDERATRTLPPDTAARIASAMQTAGRDRTLFERELMRQGIGVIRTNDAGRIYGATFINHADKTVFNGSRLGRGFPPMYSTTFSPDGTVFTRRSNPPEWNVPHSSRAYRRIRMERA